MDEPTIHAGSDAEATVAPEAAGTAGADVEAKPAAGEAELVVKAVDVAALAPAIEAILLSVDRPVPGPRLAEALGLVHDAEDAREPGVEAGAKAAGASRKRGKADRPATPLGQVEAGVALLNQQYESTGRSFRIERIAGGYRVMTLPAFAPALEAFHGKRERHALSRAAVETLAIIAYKQPITRAALESIRGVACGEVLRSLMERRLVTVVGRAEELGRPMLYGTSRAFLETFGLSSVKDLPGVDELQARADVDD